ncbi:MAG: DUF4215 domain-containing protein [Myxococcota bacterium]
MSHESATNVTALHPMVRVSTVRVSMVRVSGALAVSLLAIATAACASGEWSTDGAESGDSISLAAGDRADGGRADDGRADDGRADSGRADSGEDDACDSGDEGCPCVISDDCASGLECDLGVCLRTVETCGDGVQDGDEECDDGPDNADDAACKSDCTRQTCGDGFVGPDEACDDGNTDDADGCTQQCDCRLTFDDDDHTYGWELTGGWTTYDEAPVSSMPAVPFMSQGPAFGTDGNRHVPYPGQLDEFSSATTSSFMVPAVLRFRSWHVDEGHSDDAKRVMLSVDEGQTWTSVVDCVTGPNDHLPFCQLSQDPRDEAEWDEIEIDMADFAGLLGRLRFEYEADGICCTFEQGWFIDDLNGFGCT